VLAAPERASAITAPDATFMSWALLNRADGTTSGSPNSPDATSSIESMIKPWIAADHLRRLAEAGEEPTQRELAELRLMIVDSNDSLAEKYYRMGGADAVIRRLSFVCRLSQLEVSPGRWSHTGITARDAVRYGQCLADGRAAGPKWTQWTLGAMRQVRGGIEDQVSAEVQGGRWGIIDGLPRDLADELAIKNGWTLKSDGWHIGCLAIHDDWVLAVMMRTPASLQSAADCCASIAQRLVAAPGR
jgi:hypothetical protein